MLLLLLLLVWVFQSPSWMFLLSLLCRWRWVRMCVLVDCCWYYCIVVGLLLACLLSRAVLQREEERVKWWLLLSVMPILEVKSVRRRAGGKLGYVSQGPWMVSPTCAAPGHCQSSQSVQSLRAGCERQRPMTSSKAPPTPTQTYWRRWRYSTQIEDTQGYRRPQSTPSRYTVLHVA